ncbi:galactosylceramidase [Glycomyces sp. NPDC049804]|uniref:galactosylceramidase n=1 Tax=Glycomyces sp. NPDC049804 TaxID=3154363 RepID=UPI0034365C84
MQRPVQVVELREGPGDRRFDGIGAVNGGGATSVLLKDYPEPQRGQILDLVFAPKFGASVSAMLVEVPGDGNSTQGSMPSHMHTRGDLDAHRGYTWWVMKEAKRRNPALSLDAVAWSAPGWIGEGEFWSQDMADYYVSWARLLQDVHGLDLDAIGCRNEKGVSLDFAKRLRAALDEAGFASVLLHAFDNWPDDKFDFVDQLRRDPDAAKAIDVIGAHVMYGNDMHAPAAVQEWAEAAGKPIWNTEDHVYRPGFDCLIGIVACFNENYLRSKATKTVLWYDVAGVYPIEPYAVEPAMILAHEPWSGHYRVREALWGYAHYGQFTELGWTYVDEACAFLDGGGSVVALRSPAGDFSVIAETKGAAAPQRLRVRVPGGLAQGPVTVWRSDAAEQFRHMGFLAIEDGAIEIDLDPDSVYSLSTTTGQRKGGFAEVPDSAPFPLPYRDTFAGYGDPAARGHLPRFTADIAGAFELVPAPEGAGICLRQVVPAPTLSWAPDWRPYTIIGDADWSDYEVSVDVRLEAGQSAALMGRVNEVGTGYGFIPKCYLFELAADGACRLVAVNGKDDPNELIGDAEQQALIAAGGRSPGGEHTLAEATAVPGPERWRRLTLRFDGTRITALLDGEPVLEAVDETHGAGMAGLLAGTEPAFSTPHYADLVVKELGAGDPPPHTDAGERLY